MEIIDGYDGPEFELNLHKEYSIEELRIMKFEMTHKKQREISEKVNHHEVLRKNINTLGNYNILFRFVHFVIDDEFFNNENKIQGWVFYKDGLSEMRSSLSSLLSGIELELEIYERWMGEIDSFKAEIKRIRSEQELFLLSIKLREILRCSTKNDQYSEFLTIDELFGYACLMEESELEGLRRLYFSLFQIFGFQNSHLDHSFSAVIERQQRLRYIKTKIETSSL